MHRRYIHDGTDEDGVELTLVARIGDGAWPHAGNPDTEVLDGDGFGLHADIAVKLTHCSPALLILGLVHLTS
jgi:hypothetical protein